MNLVKKRANSTGDMDQETLSAPLINARHIVNNNNLASPKPGIGFKNIRSSVDTLSDTDDLSDDDEPNNNGMLLNNESTSKARLPPNANNTAAKKISIDLADGDELAINEPIRTDDPTKQKLTHTSQNNGPRKEHSVDGSDSNISENDAGRESLGNQSGAKKSSVNSGQGNGGVTITNEEQLGDGQVGSLLESLPNNLTTHDNLTTHGQAARSSRPNKLLSDSDDSRRTSSSSSVPPNRVPQIERAGYQALQNPMPEGNSLPSNTAAKVKDAGAASGYFIQGGTGLLTTTTTIIQKFELNAWGPHNKPDPSKIENPGHFLKLSPIVADVASDAAAPFKTVEYIGAAVKSVQDLKAIRDAKNVIKEWDRLDDLARNASSSNDRNDAAAKRDALDAKKALAKKTLKDWKTKGDTLLQTSGHVKAWSGLALYGYGTALATKHCIDAAKDKAKESFWVAFRSSVKATSNGAFLMASSVLGTVFGAASSVYYAWKTSKDSKKLKKIETMAGKIATLPANMKQDALFSDVAERVKRKCSKDDYGTRFSRRTNRWRSAISAIGIVGSGLGIAKAAGVTAAFVVGATTVAAAWPVVVGVAGITALTTAFYGIYKFRRHRGSSSHKTDLQQTYDLRNKLAAPTRSDQDQRNFYSSSKVKRVVQGMAADRDCFTQHQGAQLLQRFADKALTDVDLRNLETWCERENVRSDTSAATHTLLQRLVAEGRQGSGLAGSDTARFLNHLGLDGETIEALFNSAKAAFVLGGAERDKALKAPMKLLAKQLTLR